MRDPCPFLIIVTTVALSAATASADAPAPKPRPGAASAKSGPAALDRASAQELLKEGNQLSGDGEYVEALGKFQQAYARYPSPKLLLNIGTTLRQLGRNVEAAQAYESYLAAPDADPARSAPLRRILEEIDALVGRLEVKVSPPDATVSLDGVVIPVPAGGASIRIEPGTHKLVGEKKGLPTAVQTFSVTRGQRSATLLALTPQPVVKVTPPLRIAGWIVGSLGVAGLAASGAAAITAATQNGLAKSHCDLATSHCDAQGFDAGSAAKTTAKVSTALLVAGGAAATAGLVLVLLPPAKARPIEPSLAFGVGPLGGSITIEGWF